ncbi:Thiol-disulfide oxidoreductase ResA [Candidatus Entotheonellaceae bacterium PAL068K]
MGGLILGLVCLLHASAVFATPAASLLQAAGLNPFQEPRSAVDFQLTDHTGQTLRLQDQRGKVVFLNFWATWCAPCRYEMPEMDKLFQSLRQQSFVMWAVAMQEPQEQVALFFQEQALHFTALLDLDGAVSSRYEIKGLPTTYLIDCSGALVGRAVGPRSWNIESVHTLLVTMLQDAHCS